MLVIWIKKLVMIRKMRLYFWYIFRVELLGFIDELDMAFGKKSGCKDGFCVFGLYIRNNVDVIYWDK